MPKPFFVTPFIRNFIGSGSIIGQANTPYDRRVDWVSGSPGEPAGDPPAATPGHGSYVKRRADAVIFPEASTAQQGVTDMSAAGLTGLCACMRRHADGTGVSVRLIDSDCVVVWSNEITGLSGSILSGGLWTESDAVYVSGSAIGTNSYAAKLAIADGTFDWITDSGVAAASTLTGGRGVVKAGNQVFTIDGGNRFKIYNATTGAIEGQSGFGFGGVGTMLSLGVTSDGNYLMVTGTLEQVEGYSLPVTPGDSPDFELDLSGGVDSTLGWSDFGSAAANDAHTPPRVRGDRSGGGAWISAGRAGPATLESYLMHMNSSLLIDIEVDTNLDTIVEPATTLAWVTDHCVDSFGHVYALYDSGDYDLVKYDETGAELAQWWVGDGTEIANDEQRGTTSVAVDEGGIVFIGYRDGDVASFDQGIIYPPPGDYTRLFFFRKDINLEWGTPVLDWIAPPGVTSITVFAQGAGGGGAYSPSKGGGGGWVEATIDVTPGETLNVVIGLGGIDYNSGATGGLPGGGDGTIGVSYQGGGGGGYTALRRGTTNLVVAGGGGGGGTTDSGNASGGGGGNVAQNGSGPTAALGGRGATDVAGGAGGTGTNNGFAGTSLQGGDGHLPISNRDGGGGGGGGYFGGGGGACNTVDGAGGGGGSSYVPDPTATGVSYIDATSNVAAGFAQPEYHTVFDAFGYGGNASQDGNQGMLRISYTVV